MRALIREFGYILREPLGVPFALLTGLAVGLLITAAVIG